MQRNVNFPYAKLGNQSERLRSRWAQVQICSTRSRSHCGDYTWIPSNFDKSSDSLRLCVSLRVIRDRAQTRPHDPPSRQLAVRMLSACQYRQTFLLVSCAGNGIMFVCGAEVQWLWSLCSLKVVKSTSNLQHGKCSCVAYCIFLWVVVVIKICRKQAVELVRSKDLNIGHKILGQRYY